LIKASPLPGSPEYEVVMSHNDISKPKDFRRAVERTNVEQVELPSGLSVLLCRPPIFAALEMGRAGTHLQAKVTDARPEEVKVEDVEAFTNWLTKTLERLFLEPRFSISPRPGEIGLADILIDDLKFIFRWLRGEVFSEKLEARSEKLENGDSSSSFRPSSSSTEDLGRFPGGQGAPAVSGGSGETQPVPPERTDGTERNAGVPAGLRRG
jgi:hypothetical protein